MKVLVTGFDPFGTDTINPALETIKRLPTKVGEHDVVALEIPTVAFKSLKVIEAAIEEHDPDIVLSIGQAGGRSDITIERVGVNWDDFRIKDNDGQQFVDRKIFADGPDAYIVELPIKAMVANIHKRGIPASVSFTAGSFVCNHVLYGVSHMLATKYPTKKNGFIHIPYLPEQVLAMRNMPSMSQECILEAIIAAIEAIGYDEVSTAGGKIC